MSDPVKEGGGDSQKHAEGAAADQSCSRHPLVSIILCTHGIRPTLAPCLEVLSRQDCRNREILLVLNGPPNESFQQTASRFPVTQLYEPRPGVSLARNTAVKHARGEILAFVDDDISVEPHWLHELLNGFDSPEIACVTGRLIPEGPLYIANERAGRFYMSERALSEWTLKPSDAGWFQAIMGTPVGFGCNMAFRKSFLENYSLFPPDLGAGSVIGSCDEFYMFLQVLKFGFRLRHIPTAAATHYFEDDIPKQKRRSAQLCAGAVAFSLKLMTDEKTLRGPTAKWLLSGLIKRLRHVLSGKSLNSEPQELLSFREKLRAYLSGIRIFRQSRHAGRNID